MKPPLRGLLLAGGRSTRMGRDKASMILRGNGQTQAANALRLLEGSCAGVFLSLREGQEKPEGCGSVEILRDAVSCGGPLAGILTAMRHDPEAAWLVLACDLPFVDAEVVSLLLAGRDDSPFTAFASAVDGLPEPLCAIYAPTALPILEEHAARGHVCPRHIMAEEGTRLLELPAAARHALENINTPRDLEMMTRFSDPGAAAPERAGETPGREIRLGWFGFLAEQRGRREEMLVTPAGTVGELFAELAARDGTVGFTSGVRFAVNDEFAPPDHPLKAGDKVVFMPPFSGG
ncbi:MAG: NTP transferase domain-containing protein [Chthoniobacterales bacterium]|jgi:molybdopterin-guanine dinucleotide biosynthesis protein A